MFGSTRTPGVLAGMAALFALSSLPLWGPFVFAEPDCPAGMSALERLPAGFPLEEAESFLLADRPEGRRRYLIELRREPLNLASFPSSGPDRFEAIKRTLETQFAVQHGSLMARAWPWMTARVSQAYPLASVLALDLTPAEAQAFRKHPEVEAVHENRPVFLDLPTPQRPERAPGDTDDSTWGLLAIHAKEGRQQFQVDGSGILVGILDTGFDPDHPDLAGSLEAFRDLTRKRKEAYDDNGHGTHCAGTIGGRNTQGFDIGVAPGVRFVAGKIFSGSGYTSLEIIMQGMEWVVDPDGKPGSGDEPRLVSNSWGGAPSSEVFRPLVRSWNALGVLPVFAGGNAGPRRGSIGSPGGFPESFAVGASTVRSEVASFSSRGPSHFDGQDVVKPDVSAPGHNVTSARVGGGYVVYSGTSMATPHVAGVAALLFERNPSLTADEVRLALEATATQLGSGEKNNDWGYGLVHVPKALEVVGSPPAR